MRVRTKIWIAVAAVCVALTVYEIPNAREVWRCLRALRQIKSKLVDKTPARSVLSDNVIAVDPEAADILRYCLAEPNVEDLAEMVAKYPQNEFFLAQLAYKITESSFLDARAAMALADRLIALDPNNAHYRYIKGWILLKPPRDFGREREAVEQFEAGNKLEDFYLPYSNFRQRVAKLSDEARLNPLERNRAEPSETGIYWDLVKFISRAYGGYPKLDRDSFRRLTAAVAEAAERLLNNAQHNGHLNHGDLLLVSCEGTRLRYLDLSPAEARQARFRLSRSEEIKDILGAQTIAPLVAYVGLMKLTLVIAVFTLFLLPLSLPFVWLFLVIVNRLCGWAEDVSVGVLTPILFVIGLAGYFGLAMLYGYLTKLLSGRIFATLAFIGTATITWICIALYVRNRVVGRAAFERPRLWASRSCKMLWVLGAVADAGVCSIILAGAGPAKWLAFMAVLVCWSALCAVVWGALVFRHHLFGIITSQELMPNRFGQLAFILLPMTGILGLLRPLPAMPLVLAFITVLLVGLVSANDPVGLFASLNGVWHIFGREGPIVRVRTKLARMMSIIVLIIWIALLVDVHISGGKWSKIKSDLTDTLSADEPLPEANRGTYERVLSRKYTNDPNAGVRSRFKEDAGLPMELHLVSPEDLRAIIDARYAEGRPIREEMLLKLMWRGGHDIRPIVVKTLKDPNALNVLIRRAKWKEMAVKDQLESVFEDKISQLVETIAPIRQDPNSIESLLIRFAWGDSTARSRLQQAAQRELLELSERVRGQDGDDELRSELLTLMEMDSLLRSSLPVKRLVMDANMPELLENTPKSRTSGRGLLTSLFEIAGALAFLSDPQEATGRFYRVFDLVAPAQDERDQSNPGRAASVLLRAWAGDYRESLFYRSLTGVPRPDVTELLKEYMRRRRFPYPLDHLEFLDAFAIAGDRELAEWLFQNVAESYPTMQVTEYPDLVPTLSPIDISDVKKMRRIKRSEDMSDRYLEPTFLYLGVESIPLLLGYLGSENEQLRAFVVWRVTSLGYEWTDEQLAALRRDLYWKVRMNAIFAHDRDELATFVEDDNPLVRTVARILIEAGRH